MLMKTTVYLLPSDRSLALERWKQRMASRPNIVNNATKRLQKKINDLIPDKVHQVMTAAIREMVKGVLFGSKYTTLKKHHFHSIDELEVQVEYYVKYYSNTAAAEGAITGFGGFISGLADFPLWLSLKMKMLFAIANAYGFDVHDYKERLFILHIFQLTFSSKQHRNDIFETVENWNLKVDELPDSHKDFDWKTFQLEYRDFIDLAKLIQLIPGIGAVAGGFVNLRYTRRLGVNAMNAYRLRLYMDHKLLLNATEHSPIKSVKRV